MSTQANLIWVFFNSENPNQKVEVLGNHSASEFVKLLRHNEMTSWHVQEKGKTTSCAVKNHSKFATSQQSENIISFQKDIDADTQVDKKTNANEKRNFKRVEASYKVSIELGEEMFTSYTKNISSGGLLVQGLIPEYFMSKVCQITIHSGNNLIHLQFAGKVISSSHTETRIKFDETSSGSSFKALVSFIESIEGKQKKHRILKAA